MSSRVLLDEVAELTPQEVDFEILDKLKAPVPLAGITELNVTLYREEAPDPDNVVNGRDAIPLILGAVVLTGLPNGLTFAYAQKPTGPNGALRWTGTIGFTDEDMRVADPQLAYEHHVALFDCITTGGPLHPELVFPVRNIRRVGAV